jgi:ABC-type branched-subunit amino acid transport system substrate-binding protein
MAEAPRFDRRTLLAGAAAGLVPRPARADEPAGLYRDRIVFGQVAVISGPAAGLGIGMRDGLLAAFGEANAKGGVGGRKLELATRDDGYEPGRSLLATKQLIAEGVFALVGAVGTPTSLAAHPVAGAAGVPFIGPFTGAEGLRTPYKPHIVNIRASYYQETEAMAERLTKDLGYSRFAILYQDDAFGRAGLEGIKRALARRSLTLVEEAIFQRNTLAVKTAVLDIKAAAPEAIVLIGPYAPCAAFIELARSFSLKAALVNISFVGSEQLAAALGPRGKGVFVTQVVPHPADLARPVVQSYRAALRAIQPQAPPGYVSLEGYIVGRAVIAALDRLGREPTPTGLLTAFAAAPVDLDGFRIAFAPGANQGSDAVFLSAIDAAGALVPIDRFSLS